MKLKIDVFYIYLAIALAGLGVVLWNGISVNGMCGTLIFGSNLAYAFQERFFIRGYQRIISEQQAMIEQQHEAMGQVMSGKMNEAFQGLATAIHEYERGDTPDPKMLH